MAIRMAAFTGHPRTGKLTAAFAYVRNVLEHFDEPLNILYMGEQDIAKRTDVADFTFAPPLEKTDNILLQTQRLATHIREHDVRGLVLCLPWVIDGHMKIDVSQLFRDTDLRAFAYTDTQNCGVVNTNNVLTYV